MDQEVLRLPRQQNILPYTFSLTSKDEYKFIAHELISLTLSSRQLCDLELLLNGGFAPLQDFMDKKDYEQVLRTMHLSTGQLWPMPITLDVCEKIAEQIKLGEEIALRDAEGLLLAILKVNDIWQVNKADEAQAIFGTHDRAHPGVTYLYEHTKEFYLGGKLLSISLPCHYDFAHLRFTPAELKKIFKEKNWEKIVAFQTRNPMHRAHQELTRLAAEQTGAKLLLHPVVGMTKPGDIDYYTRVRCYEFVQATYPPNSTFLSLLPLAMRMAGPREAIWHALIRKNYGCTHFIVGRDHAGPGKNSLGQSFYAPYAAQLLAMQYQQEIGITIVPFQEMVYSYQSKNYFTLDKFPKDETPAFISGTELRERLQQNLEIPEWFSYPQVINELRRAHPPKYLQGFTIFLTGLPSSGKSTLANGLVLKIREATQRQITLLDGDIIRTHLSQELGFSKEDREINISRIAFVAREVTKHGGIVICALVAPFLKAREIVNKMVSEVGGYIEVYVSTPLSICERRDRKGMYKKAREGVIKQFTGISDVYEPPLKPDIEINTTHQHPKINIAEIMDKLKLLGYLR